MMIKKFSKYGVIVCALALVMSFACFAAEGDPTPVAVSDFSNLLTSLQSQISVTTIVSVLAVGVAAAAGLAFMWWGARKLVGMLMAAFKKGKVKI